MIVDGKAHDGLLIDTDPFVVGLATRLDDARVITSVIPRHLLE